MADDKYSSLQAKLDSFETWPHEYTFKFIVPMDRCGELEAMFAGHEYSLRPSRTGKYISLTCVREMPNSNALISVYKRVEEIEGSYAL